MDRKHREAFAAPPAKDNLRPSHKTQVGLKVGARPEVLEDLGTSHSYVRDVAESPHGARTCLVDAHWGILALLSHDNSRVGKPRCAEGPGGPPVAWIEAESVGGLYKENEYYVRPHIMARVLGLYTVCHCIGSLLVLRTKKARHGTPANAANIRGDTQGPNDLPLITRLDARRVPVVTRIAFSRGLDQRQRRGLRREQEEDGVHRGHTRRE